MTTIHVNLPDELKTKAEQRAAESGHDTLQQYVESLIRVDADARDYGAPPELSFGTEAELKTKLLAGINSGPSAEITDQDWQSRQRRLIQRHRPSEG